MNLRARQFQFTFPGPALVMGILNVTPDSFSDGGHFLEPEAAVAHALELEAQGAAIIDIGGESTRPRALPVEEPEELRRTIPVIKKLSGKLKVPISIDTRKVEVARAAIDAGASVVNDVGANRTDPAMWRLVAETGAAYVCVHMQGMPETMQISPVYRDVVADVKVFFEERLTKLSDCAVAPDQIILDPGIGFGKTMEHNLQLIGGLREFTSFARPLLLGVSRKSFLAKAAGGPQANRLPAALVCAVLALQAGTQMFRVHDVVETIQALRMAEAIIRRATSA